MHVGVSFMVWCCGKVVGANKKEALFQILQRQIKRWRIDSRTQLGVPTVASSVQKHKSNPVLKWMEQINIGFNSIKISKNYV